MIDIHKISYHVILVQKDGSQYDVTDYIEELGWEENDGQLALKASFTARDTGDKISGKTPHSLMQPGVLMVIIAGNGQKAQEVARARIETWNPTASSSDYEVKCTCYDDLYYAQKSEMNFRVKNGWSTKKAIKKCLAEWRIPMGEYKGPKTKLPETIYEKEDVADILLDILDQAHARGGDRCLLREDKGMLSVVPYYSNDPIWHFDSDNVISIDKKVSTANMVTRVVILDSESGTAVKTVNGDTDYGIRQKLQTQGHDESIKEAKKTAKATLKEKGVDTDIKIKAFDVPYIRKGDVVSVHVRTAKGFYEVLSVSHDADAKTMTMELGDMQLDNTAK